MVSAHAKGCTSKDEGVRVTLRSDGCVFVPLREENSLRLLREASRSFAAGFKSAA